MNPIQQNLSFNYVNNLPNFTYQPMQLGNNALPPTQFNNYKSQPLPPYVLT